jgi:hypothetical protein
MGPVGAFGCLAQQANQKKTNQNDQQSREHDTSVAQDFGDYRTFE